MSTITGTIPDAPQFPLSKILSSGYTSFFSYVKTDFTLLESVNMYLVGEPYASPQVGTYKLMNDWWNLNTQKVQRAGLYIPLRVSSWACVIDITWKKDFAPVRTASAAPQTTAPFTYAALGATGDTIGVYIRNDSNALGSFQQGALLLRRTVTTAGVNSNIAANISAKAQVDTIMGTTNSIGLTTINYGNNAVNVKGSIAFEGNQECDSNWIVPTPTVTPTADSAAATASVAKSYGCYGMANPWGVSTITQYRTAGLINGVQAPEVKGYVRVWKWLAEEQADRSKVWSLERKDKVSILLYEMVDKVKDPANNAVWKAESYNWYTEVVDGIKSATSLTVGLTMIGLTFLTF